MSTEQTGPNMAAVADSALQAQIDSINSNMAAKAPIDWTNANFIPSPMTDASHGNRGGGALHALATTVSNGFMSFLDKIKLNSMPSVQAVGTVTINLSLLNTGTAMVNIPGLTSSNRAFLTVTTVSGGLGISNIVGVLAEPIGVCTTDTLTISLRSITSLLTPGNVGVNYIVY